MFQANTGRMPGITRPPVQRIAATQVLLLVPLCLVAWRLVDINAAQSALLGGIVAIAPQMYFTWQAFRYQGAGSTRKIVAAFFKGTRGKFLLTVAMFATIFWLVRPLQVGVLFTAYVTMIVLQVVITARIVK